MAYSSIRRVLPLPNTAPMMQMPANQPAPARPMGGLSSSSQTEGGGQQAGGGNPMGQAMQMMALKKMMGGSAPSAVSPTMSTGASSGAGAGGGITDSWIGSKMGLPGSESVGDTMGAVPGPGPVEMAQLGPPGIGGATPSGIGAYDMGMGSSLGFAGGGATPTAAAVEAMPGYSAALAPAYGEGLYGGAAIGAEAAGLAGAEGGVLAASAAPAMEVPAAAAMAEGGALAAAAPEAGMLAGMGPAGWAALGGLGLFSIGNAFDWW
jgi:hypothetical protein